MEAWKRAVQKFVCAVVVVMKTFNVIVEKVQFQQRSIETIDKNHRILFKI